MERMQANISIHFEGLMALDDYGGTKVASEQIFQVE